jgi:hypothetical protein
MPFRRYGKNALDTGCSIDVATRFGKALTLFANNRDDMCVQFGNIHSCHTSLQFEPIKQLLCPLTLSSN